MADSASFVKISHIAESGIAPAADNYSSPAVRRRPLLVADEPLHGEKLSISSAEDNLPLKRGLLYGALVSLILGCVIILIMSLVF